MKNLFLLLLTFWIFNLNAQIDQGLLFHFPIDNSIEETANGYGFTIVGDSSLSVNRLGGANCAWDLSDSTNYIKAALTQGDFSLDSFSSFSFSFWMQLDSADIFYDGDYHSIIQFRDNDDTYFGMGLYDLQTPLYADDYMGRNYGLWDDDWNRSLNLGYDTELWHHIVFIYNQGRLEYYRNGILYASDTLDSDNVLRFADTLYIGGVQTSGIILSDFYGKLDDIRIYGRALDPTEVIALRDVQESCMTSTTKEHLMVDFPVYTYQKPSRIEVQKEGRYQLELYNLQGKLVYQDILYGYDAKILAYHGFHSGIYIARISNETGAAAQKIYIE